MPKPMLTAAHAAFVSSPSRAALSAPVKRLLKPLIAGVVLAGALAAQAATVTYHYTAEGRAGTESAGATVTGTFGFDNTVTDSNPSADRGSYVAAGFFTGTVSGGPQDGLAFILTGLDLSVNADPPSNPGQSFFVPNSGTLFYFSETVSAALTTDALPGDLTLSDWTSKFMRIADGQRQPFYEFTSLSRDGRQPNPVPEPATLGLLGLGLAGLAVARRRRQA